MIAALFVQRDGCYYGLRDVDPWDEERDARVYQGPHPVVAHPPCARWGRYWWGGPGSPRRYAKGEDGGCFAAALEAVRKWGGVLEHPEGSAAWPAFGLTRPPKAGGWIMADLFDSVNGLHGWTCCVDQGHYGHPAAKATWLYAVCQVPPKLMWGRCGNRLDLEGTEGKARKKLIKRGVCERLSKRKRAATPLAFRDLLLEIARGGQNAR